MADRFRSYLPAAAGFGVPFVLVTYLAIEAGGYDLIVRSQVGIIIWWAILLGVVAGLLPLTRVPRGGWIGLSILGALVLWTGVAATAWSGSTERGMIELSRTVMLLGTFLLVLLLQGRDGLRQSLSAVGSAVAVIASIALASKFNLDLFPASNIPENFPTARLNYPLEYWNGLAALLAMGLAPLLWMACSGRSAAGRALAAGSIPLVILACYLTASRGGAIEVAATLLVLVALFPKRLLLIPTLALSAVGSGVLLLLIAQRPELRDGDLGDLATSQGSEMLWLTVGIFVLVAAVHHLVGQAIERRIILLPAASRKTAKWFGIATGIAALLFVLAAVGSGYVGDRWGEFKEPAVGDGTVSRLGNLSSGERYKVWEAAVDASASEPLTGIGPGTFEYFWAREGTGVQFVRDAHSLYLEGLAELGPVGLLLVLAMVLTPIGFATTGAIRRGSSERRALLAASAASMTAFAVAAGIDWTWELTVLPVIFLVLAAGVLGPSAYSRKGRTASRFRKARLDWKLRISLVAASFASLVLIALPLASTILVRKSQESFRGGNDDNALEQANRAIDIQPYSASALVQKSLVLSDLDRTTDAVSAAKKATDEEAVNWRNWYALGLALRNAGERERAVAAFDRAANLNVRSAFLASSSERAAP